MDVNGVYKLTNITGGSYPAGKVVGFCSNQNAAASWGDM